MVKVTCPVCDGKGILKPVKCKTCEQEHPIPHGLAFKECLNVGEAQYAYNLSELKEMQKKHRSKK